MSSRSLCPLNCPACKSAYSLKNRMCTLSCGHSQCDQCFAKKKKCCTCLAKANVVPSLDVSTFVCAGCNRHYINHYDVVINQVRILKCGHRRMCSHNNSKCMVCGSRAVEVAVDVALTALVCRVCITDPSLPTVPARKKENTNCVKCLRRCMPCICHRPVYENI